MTTSRSSDLLTADTLIWTGRGLLTGVSVLADGTNAATVVIYDGLTATGKVLAKVIVDATTTESHIDFSRPVVAEIGIFADIAGTGAEYIVYTG